MRENEVVIHCDVKSGAYFSSWLPPVQIFAFFLILFSIGLIFEGFSFQISYPFNFIFGGGGLFLGILIFYLVRVKGPRILKAVENVNKKVVIDDRSIKKYVNNELITEICYAEINRIGAFWNYVSYEPIIGFWIKNKDHKEISVDIWKGWYDDESRDGLEKILSFREKYGFNVEKYLQKHVKKNRGVWKHRRKTIESKIKDLKAFKKGIIIINTFCFIVFFISFLMTGNYIPLGLSILSIMLGIILIKLSG